MRSKWFLLGVLTMAMLALGAAACGDDDEEEGAEDTGTARGTSPAARATTPAADGGDTTGFAAIVSGVEDDEIGGAVTIEEGGNGVEVVVDILGLPEGPHANHLHHGTCEDQGEVHITLTELEPDDIGIATAETTFDDPPLEHFATGHYYAVHTGGDDNVGAVIGCGNVVESD